ncbi:hypothetical protein EDEG_01222 [Edhazardia aedis USNM 41457]|uniref:Uncharacterized protein n=1 Tax=Edhazardia aedis (strain USNM 41457) TaxID=1003232 RepID=J8ZY68_EDHAE|nr:hypothetical protein EDEG_01222 [Edhazardia aedis USNM 41457]|eukprot:EJW04573.1 hypothetical protein EDEG_01222 [Edhazardia aedis USNM 41457]
MKEYIDSNNIPETQSETSFIETNIFDEIVILERDEINFNEESSFLQTPENQKLKFSRSKIINIVVGFLLIAVSIVTILAYLLSKKMLPTHVIVLSVILSCLTCVISLINIVLIIFKPHMLIPGTKFIYIYEFSVYIYVLAIAFYLIMLCYFEIVVKYIENP